MLCVYVCALCGEHEKCYDYYHRVLGQLKYKCYRSTLSYESFSYIDMFRPTWVCKQLKCNVMLGPDWVVGTTAVQLYGVGLPIDGHSWNILLILALLWFEKSWNAMLDLITTFGISWNIILWLGLLCIENNPKE